MVRAVDEPTAVGGDLFHSADLTDSAKPCKGTPAVTLGLRSSMIAPPMQTPSLRDRARGGGRRVPARFRSRTRALEEEDGEARFVEDRFEREGGALLGREC